jgi:hypothetical protein
MSINETTLSAVALAVAVMHKAAAAQAKAETALDRARGNTWGAVKEAALCFDAPMTDEARTALSGELAREYTKRYTSKEAAKSAASQHAKAIFALTHGKGKADAASLKDYLSSAFAVTRANAGNAPKNGAPVASKAASAQGAAVASADVPTVDRSGPAPVALSTAGLPVELGSALVQLIDMARKNARVAEALVVLVNIERDKGDAFMRAADYLLTEGKQATAQKLAQAFGADKVITKPRKAA